MARMPVCRWGEACKVKDCPYRHIAEDDKPQCVFYQQGFCAPPPPATLARRLTRLTRATSVGIHGTQCRYRHYKQPPEKRPLIADFSLGIAQGRKFEDATAARVRRLSTAKRRSHDAVMISRPADDQTRDARLPRASTFPSSSPGRLIREIRFGHTATRTPVPGAPAL